jgi:hypothetical protein
VKVWFSTTGTRNNIANSIGEALREIPLVRFSNSRISETTHGTEYTATVNAVADRQHSAVLEGVPKPAK